MFGDGNENNNLFETDGEDISSFDFGEDIEGLNFDDDDFSEDEENLDEDELNEDDMAELFDDTDDEDIEDDEDFDDDTDDIDDDTDDYIDDDIDDEDFDEDTENTLVDDDSDDTKENFTDDANNTDYESDEDNTEDNDNELEEFNYESGDSIDNDVENTDDTMDDDINWDDESSDGAYEHSIDADDSGAIINAAALLQDEDDDRIINQYSDILSDSGELVVQQYNNGERSFELEYIDAKNIIIPKRIRKSNSTESLNKSIKSTGLLQPITVALSATKGMYILIHGFRRLIACSKAGINPVPAVINTKISTTEIPIIEAMCNGQKSYTIKEKVEYIDYLEKEMGIFAPSMIEYLADLAPGEYAKLKDIINDDDEDIVTKMMEGQYTIEMAFKKLEQRRRKESADEKDNQTAQKVYGDESQSGVNKVSGAGEDTSSGPALTDDEIAEITISVDDIHEVEEESLDDMVEKGKQMDGFEAHRQDPGHREIIDPAIRKAVMARDDNTCQCCKRGGPDYVDILDLHHIMEVYLGGVDSVENSIAVCLNCHKQVHLYAFNQLHIPTSKDTSELSKMSDNERAVYVEEQNKYKRIVKLGNVIREGLQRKGMKLEQAKKDHPIAKIGRQMPGTKNTIA